MALTKSGTAKVIEQCVKDAGITEHKEDGYISMEHFTGKAKIMLDRVFDSYYEGEAVKCEAELNEAIKILEAAKVFNKNFGL